MVYSLIEDRCILLYLCEFWCKVTIANRVPQIFVTFSTIHLITPREKKTSCNYYISLNAPHHQ